MHVPDGGLQQKTYKVRGGGDENAYSGHADVYNPGFCHAVHRFSLFTACILTVFRKPKNTLKSTCFIRNSRLHAAGDISIARVACVPQ